MDNGFLRGVVAAAVRAPSVHNTQPWRFVGRDSTLEVWADRSRQLFVEDPAGRELHVSCGAAVALAEAYLRAQGVDASVDVVAGSGDPDHLADIVLGDRAEPTDADGALGAAIERRHTDRRPFSPRPVPEAVVHELVSAAQRPGCWLRVIASDEDVAAVAVALTRADDALGNAPDYADELRRWTGREATAPDGVPREAAVDPDPQHRATNYRLRDLDPDRPPASGGVDRADPPPVERPLVVVLGTDEDDERAWVQAGRSLGELLLTASAAGLVASPMTQALELAGTRTRLAADLGVRHPQMVLRLGYPEGDQPAAAARRPVDEVLTFA